MATQRKEDFTEATRWRRRPRPTFARAAQAVSGLLLVLLTMHMVAQHFVVSGACAAAPSGSWPGCCSAWPWPPSSTACGCWT